MSESPAKDASGPGSGDDTASRDPGTGPASPDLGSSDLQGMVRQLEAENARLMEMDRALRRAHGQFASLIAHELRNPVGTIKGYVQLAHRWLTANPADERLLGALEVVGGQASRLSRLAQDLSDIGRLDSGRFALAVAAVDLRDLARECVERARESLPGRTVNLTVPDAEIPVRIDVAQIERVVDKLLANAAKHSMEDRPIEVAVHFDGRQAVLSVTDQGEGIPPDDAGRMFGRTDGTEGVVGRDRTGAGLYIARGIVELHHGRIWVNSVLEQGSTFSLSLPLVD